MTGIELLDSAGDVIESEGGLSKYGDERWKEATIPENETLIGLKVCY